MTQPHATTAPRRALRAIAVLACLPYIALKVAWIAGSHVGIPEGSDLRRPEERPVLLAFNGVSVLMDAAVVVLALLLTRPWGARVPAWLLALPVWCAGGLLAPIMTGFPAQLLVKALGDGAGAGAVADDSRFLADWVFGLVYGGFILQGLALGALFTLYARDRWGHLWRGRIADLPADSPTRGAQRLTAVVATVLTVPPAATHALWAGGSTAGLSAARAADRTSDFYVLEAMYVVFALATAAGALTLAFRAGHRLRLVVPLGLAWIGSGALACWGAWLTLTGLASGDGAKAPSAVMNMTYAVQMIVGLLVLTAGAYFLGERGAQASKAPVSPRTLELRPL
ncbi:hypothetical protein ACWC5C_03320 [Streptomyces sp. NPDC001700]